MNLLAGTLYDSGTAVSKATTSLLAMTALDTTNLRLTGTVPPSGKIYWKVKATLHGATTYPQVMLGVMSGASVVARMAAMLSGGNLAATTVCACWAEGIITGTPGAAFTYDAAYGVETVVAATGLKYGGPNNTTGNDNWGGIAFELWDACPAYTPSSGAAPTSTVHVKLDLNATYIDTEVAAILAAVDTEVAAIKVKTDFLPSATAGAVGGLFIAGSNAATTVNFTGTLSGSVGSVTGAVGSVTGNVGGNVVGSVASVTGAVGSVTGLTAANLDVAVSTRLATASYTAPDNATITAIAGYVDTEVAAIKGVVDKLDTAMELDGAVYRFTLNALELAPAGAGGLDAAGVRAAVGLASANLDTQLSGISTKTTNLPAAPASSGDVATVGTAVAALVAPDNAGIAAIQAKTDQLAFTGANVQVTLEAIRGAALTGTGSGPYGA